MLLDFVLNVESFLLLSSKNYKWSCTTCHYYRAHIFCSGKLRNSFFCHVFNNRRKKSLRLALAWPMMKNSPMSKLSNKNKQSTHCKAVCVAVILRLKVGVQQKQQVVNFFCQCRCSQIYTVVCKGSYTVLLHLQFSNWLIRFSFNYLNLFIAKLCRISKNQLEKKLMNWVDAHSLFPIEVFTFLPCKH